MLFGKRMEASFFVKEEIRLQMKDCPIARPGEFTTVGSKNNLNEIQLIREFFS